MSLLADLQHGFRYLEMILRVLIIILVPVTLGLVSAVWGIWMVSRENRLHNLREARKQSLIEAKASPNERSWPQS